jgi:hypothetical protein
MDQRKNTHSKSARYSNNPILVSASSCYKKHAVRLAPPLVYRLIIVTKALGSGALSCRELRTDFEALP